MNKQNRLLTLLLTAALLASLALFLFQQNFALQVEQVELTFEALPPEFDGLRVAELSDLHGRSFGRGNARLLDALRQALRGKIHALLFKNADKTNVNAEPAPAENKKEGK